MANRSFSSQTPDYPLKPMGFTPPRADERKIMANETQAHSVSGQIVKIAVFFFQYDFVWEKM